MHACMRARAAGASIDLPDEEQPLLQGDDDNARSTTGMACQPRDTILDAYLPPIPRTATFKVTGMTCASCVSSLESALRALRGVASASVSLMTERAQVVYDSAQASLGALKDCIEDCGFDAALVADPHHEPGAVRLVIGGMTCAACVSYVEAALSRTAGVLEATVNFATGQAVVKYEPDCVGPRDMLEAVEDAGYEADVWRGDADDSASALHE